MTATPWVFRMRWVDLLFADWPVPVEALRPLVPHALEIDTLDGQAWLGVVPFRMEDVAPRFLPALPGPGAFPELNVRTYVSCRGRGGVWFLSLVVAATHSYRDSAADSSRTLRSCERPRPLISPRLPTRC